MAGNISDNGLMKKKMDKKIYSSSKEKIRNIRCPAFFYDLLRKGDCSANTQREEDHSEEVLAPALFIHLILMTYGYFY